MRYSGKIEKFLVDKTSLRISKSDNANTSINLENQILFDSYLEARLFVYLSNTYGKDYQLTCHPTVKLDIGLLTKSYKPDFLLKKGVDAPIYWEAKGLALPEFTLKLSCLLCNSKLEYNLVFADKTALRDGFKKRDLIALYRKFNQVSIGDKDERIKTFRFKAYTIKGVSELSQWNPLTMEKIV